MIVLLEYLFMFACIAALVGVIVWIIIEMEKMG